MRIAVRYDCGAARSIAIVGAATITPSADADAATRTGASAGVSPTTSPVE